MATCITRSTHGKRKSENQGISQAELSAPETEQEVARYMSGEANALDEFEVEVEEAEEEQIVASGAHSEGANPITRWLANTRSRRSAHSQRRAARMVMQWQSDGQPRMIIPTNAFANGPRAYRPDKEPDKDR